MADPFKAIRDEQLQKSVSNNLFDEMFPAEPVELPTPAVVTPQTAEIATEEQVQPTTVPKEEGPNFFDELFPPAEDKTDENFFEKLLTPADKQNEDIDPSEYLAGTSIEGIFKKGFKGIQKKVQDTSFIEWLVTTPMAEHYAKLGAEVDADKQLERLGVPETFDVPDLYVKLPNGQLGISTKYPPHVRALLEAAGGDVNETKDRMIAGIFLEGLTAKGFVKIASKFGVMAASKASWLKTASSMSDDALDSINRQIAKNDAGAASERLIKTFSKDVIEKGKRESLEEAKKIVKATPEAKTTLGLATLETLEEGGRRLEEISVGGNKYKIAKDGGIQPMGTSTEQDLFDHGVKNANYEKNITQVADNTVGNEVFPQSGKWEFNNLFSKGWLSWFRSPQYYARNVYDEIGKLERTKAIIKTDLISEMEPFLKHKGKDLAQKVGRIADGLDEPSLANNQLGEEGALMLDAYRRMTKKAADILELPEESRITDYLTRIWDDYKVKDPDFSIPEELVMWVKENKKHIKKRTGGKGYNLDVIRATEAYVDWVADFAARKQHKANIFKEVKRIQTVDPTRARVANAYVNNYFGELSKDPEFKNMKAFASFVKKSFADATIANNVVTFATNLTQAPYFGAARIGYIPYARGLKMAFGRFGKGEGAKKIKKILDESGVIANQSLETLTRGSSLSDLALEKLGVKKATVDKISEFSFRGMQMSEDFNKASVYLGAYDDSLTKIKAVVEARRAGKELKGAERWLKKRNIDPTDIPSEQAHKYARSATVDTQLDYSRAGMSGAAINPAVSTGYMYMTFPVKAAEMMAHTTKAAVKNLVKDPFNAIYTPEVQNAIRMGVSSAAALALADTAGISISRVVSLENLTPTLFPLWQAAIKGMGATKRAFEGDPESHKDVVKALTIGLGFKGAAPLWQMQSILQTANNNRGRKDRSQWDIYTSSGKYMYTTTPSEFLFDLMTPFESLSEEFYFEERKKQMKTKRKIAFTRRRINRARLNSEKEKEINEKRTMKAFQKELKKQEKEAGKKDSVGKRKERELRDRLRRNK